MTEQTEPIGHGQAAGGLIEARVGADGRLAALRLDPELRRAGPKNLAMDSETLAAEITAAVNAALDDFAEQARRAGAGVAQRLAKDFDDIAEDFERSLGQLSDDIGRAQRRLES